MSGENADGTAEAAGRDPWIEPPICHYLAVLRRDLAGAILPELQSPDAVSKMEMAIGLLDHLILRSHGLAALHIASSADRDALDRGIGTDTAAEAAFLRWSDEAERRIADACSPMAVAPPSAERLTQYLRGLSPGREDVTVTNLTMPAGGYSKQVVIAELGGADRPADAIVIRRDVAGGPLDTEVRAEAPVLSALHAHGIPVAEPLWIETDASVIGAPFLVSRRIAGRPAMNYRQEIQGLSADGAARQLGAILGSLHALDPAIVGRTGRPAEAYIIDLIGGFEAQWRRRRIAPSPILEDAFTWMRDNMPRGTAAPAIIHGDPTLRNLMVDHGEATALLDWETWHVGDPAEDLAYCRDEIEALMPWDAFMAVYHAHGGPPMDEERLGYWSVWKYLRGAVTSISMIGTLASDPDCDLRMAFGGMYFTRHCSLKVADFLERRRAPNAAAE